MTTFKKPKKVLILGSGALKIGEAGEFDYSGSQAIKALKEEGIKTVLINPNIATNQTSESLADEVYFLPVTCNFVEKVIEKEKPDSIMLAWGGQTALNTGTELFEKGILEKHDIQVLGTPVQVIQKTEDRQKFNAALDEIEIKYPTSFACHNIDEAMEAGEKIGFPLIIRAAFALGGKGSGFAENKAELKNLVEKAFANSDQILVEESLKGWKEIEYEVVRDSSGNVITVCNMENFDPLGIHTGESIVVAPSQTLNDSEYQLLRTIARKTINHLGIVGECNIQYALDPKSEDYRVIEVNARLSRSSALASKATGYPLAYIAAKLALNYSLPELKNSVTQVTQADFEPALDYLVVKIPRWDLDKFCKVSQEITSEMKSVGEIMAIGKSFEEVIQKGLRMLQIGAYGLSTRTFTFDDLEYEMRHPSPKRIFAVARALGEGWEIDKIYEITGIDPWFLGKLKTIVDYKKEIKTLRDPNKLEDKVLTKDILIKAKKLGFADVQIANYLKNPDYKENDVRVLRKELGVTPVVKQIDTLAAEFPAQTNYLYLTYHGDCHDLDYNQPSKKEKTIVLGSGAYCIGSSVEFDWCCVNTIKALEKANHETIMINYNPETVSTDYDECDKLYFDELSLERVLDIHDLENPEGLILSMGGQIPNNLATRLDSAGVNILGTPPKYIDNAENRHKFSELLDELGVDQPEWKEFASVQEAKDFADNVGYPVLIRPSYVLSGAAMSVAHNTIELEAYLAKAVKISTDAPVVVSKFELGAREIEMDAVAYEGNRLIWAISEHIENAGVHSGDATIVLPPQKIYLETIRKIRVITKKLARALHITGPFNIQFLARDNFIKVIELNLRASRSFPFVSKVTGKNFIEIATNAMLNKIEPLEYRKTHYNTLDLDYVAVKAPQFSFSRLKGADPILGVEMASTGEVACFGETLEEAFLKSMISVGFKIPEKNILMSVGRIEDKAKAVKIAKKLHKLGFKLFTTPGTGEVFKEANIPCEVLHKLSAKQSPNIHEYLTQEKIDLVINIPRNTSQDEITDGYEIRRITIDYNIPLITNLQIADLLARALSIYNENGLMVKTWKEYVKS